MKKPTTASDKTVAEMTSKAAEAIRAADTADKHDEAAEARAHARAIVFESANAPKPARVPPGLASIVERVFIPDEKLNETYEYVHKDMTLGEKLAEHGNLMRALDHAELRHRAAHRLYVSAKDEWLAYERDFAVEAAPMRKAATERLQSEKDKGVRSKQITDADVESMMAWLFPDWWREKEGIRTRLKLTVDDLLNIVETRASKCRSLQTMLSKSR